MTTGPAILFGGLIVWGIIRRIRRNIGRQLLRPRRAITSITILSLVSLLVGVASFHNTHLLLGLVSGLLLGGLLGFVGLRLTRFETTDDGHFYTPNMHIGVALSVLFVGRLIYRYVVLNNAATAQNHAQPFQSPLTFFILGLNVGYYLVYQTGILIHNHDKNNSGKKALHPGDQN